MGCFACWQLCVLEVARLPIQRMYEVTSCVRFDSGSVQHYYLVITFLQHLKKTHTHNTNVCYASVARTLRTEQSLLGRRFRF